MQQIDYFGFASMGHVGSAGVWGGAGSLLDVLIKTKGLFLLLFAQEHFFKAIGFSCFSVG